METKHTPGPWAKFGSVIRSLAGSERKVADVRIIDSEGQANANLIAAAPELMAVLQAFERISDIWLPAITSEEHEGEMQALHQARNDMLAAIAKATA
ncbi:hypothetical protein MHB_0010785 [Pseudomonas fluorescens BBc6R8]|uniref:hypothetical protein n=1 Tax=Pseudomonas fluorescens TaxID=294 RepID=UPI0002DBBD51|nr:hypothetical protein [Pseudomonas fluorescens]QQD56700.1 hypothetical protein MHB_0010785 [Pseudomonas fluorescens BBc6R8]